MCLSTVSRVCVLVRILTPIALRLYLSFLHHTTHELTKTRRTIFAFCLLFIHSRFVHFVSIKNFAVVIACCRCVENLKKLNEVELREMRMNLLSGGSRTRIFRSNRLLHWLPISRNQLRYQNY